MAEEDTLVDPAQVAQEFVDGLNAGDVDRVVGCFGADAVIQDDAGNVIVQGEQAIREHFGQIIARSPNFHVDVVSRLRVGPWVVHQEHATGLVLEAPVPDFDIADAYKVEDGKIVKCIGLM